MSRVPLKVHARPDATHSLDLNTDPCDAEHVVGDMDRFGPGVWYCTRTAHPEDPFHEAGAMLGSPYAEIVATWAETIYALEDDFEEVPVGTPLRDAYTDA